MFINSLWSILHGPRMDLTLAVTLMNIYPSILDSRLDQRQDRPQDYPQDSPQDYPQDRPQDHRRNRWQDSPTSSITRGEMKMRKLNLPMCARFSRRSYHPQPATTHLAQRISCSSKTAPPLFSRARITKAIRLKSTRTAEDTTKPTSSATRRRR